MKTATVLSAFLVGLMSVAAVPVKASTTWDFYTSCTSGCNTDSVSAGNGAEFGSGLTASAWSTGKTDFSSGSNFASAQLKNWGSWGWGVIADPAGTDSESDQTGPHAMDNKYGTDLIFLTFDEMVALNSVTIGWNGTDNPTTIASGGTNYNYNDSDISVLRYTGSSAPVIAGKTVSGLLADGWSWVGDYGNVGASNGTGTGANQGGSVSFNTGASAVYSSWWLVSAYNKNFDGTTADTLGLNGSNDAVKLLQVAGNVQSPPPPGVPEPASMVLLSVGLLGMMAIRRRRQT